MYEGVTLGSPQRERRKERVSDQLYILCNVIGRNSEAVQSSSIRGSGDKPGLSRCIHWICRFIILWNMQMTRLTDSRATWIRQANGRRNDTVGYQSFKSELTIRSVCVMSRWQNNYTCIMTCFFCCGSDQVHSSKTGYWRNFTNNNLEMPQSIDSLSGSRYGTIGQQVIDAETVPEVVYSISMSHRF